MANLSTTQAEEQFLNGIEDVLNVALTVSQEIKILALLQVLKESQHPTINSHE